MLRAAQISLTTRKGEPTPHDCMCVGLLNKMSVLSPNDTSMTYIFLQLIMRLSPVSMHAPQHGILPTTQSHEHLNNDHITQIGTDRNCAQPAFASYTVILHEAAWAAMQLAYIVLSPGKSASWRKLASKPVLHECCDDTPTWLDIHACGTKAACVPPFSICLPPA